MSRALVIVDYNSIKLKNPEYNVQIINASDNVEVCPYIQVDIPNSYFNKIDFSKFNNKTCKDSIKLINRYISKLNNMPNDISGDFFVASNKNLISMLNKIKSLSEKYSNAKWKFE